MITLDQIILEHKEKYREELIFMCGLISTDGQVREKTFQVVVIHSVNLSWINQVKNILDKTMIETVIYPVKTPAGKPYYKLTLHKPMYFVSLIIDEIGPKYLMEEKFLILKNTYYNSIKRFSTLEDEFLWLNSNEKVEILAEHLKFAKQSVWRRKKELGVI